VSTGLGSRGKYDCRKNPVVSGFTALNRSDGTLLGIEILVDTGSDSVFVIHLLEEVSTETQVAQVAAAASCSGRSACTRSTNSQESRYDRAAVTARACR
jgi:hypothetical protein